MKRRVRLLFVGFSWLIAGCTEPRSSSTPAMRMAAGGSGAAVTAGPAVRLPDAPSWTEIYRDTIVGLGCNGGALCHGGTAGALTLVGKQPSYAALVDVDAAGMNLLPGGRDCKDLGWKRVVAGDPHASLLFRKLEGTAACGEPMPPPRGGLNPLKLEQIRVWILNGAKYD